VSSKIVISEDGLIRLQQKKEKERKRGKKGGEAKKAGAQKANCMRKKDSWQVLQAVCCCATNQLGCLGTISKPCGLWEPDSKAGRTAAVAAASQEPIPLLRLLSNAGPDVEHGTRRLESLKE